MTRIVLLFCLLFPCCTAWAKGPVSHFNEFIYDPGIIQPIDSVLKVKVGDPAPDFNLKSVRGETVKLSSYRGKSNVLLSFIPAAWTPVCSDQWPGYNLAEPVFSKNNTVLLGISVDNVPTLHSWTNQMGSLWFDVLSDFWPHGRVADLYGVLRSDGTAERALVFINERGVITGVHVSDINVRPPLKLIFEELKNFSK